MVLLPSVKASDFTNLFAVIENIFLVSVPLFILGSVRRYLPLSMLAGFGLCFLIFVKVGRSRSPNLWELGLRYLFIATVGAFIAATWNIYNIGSLFYYPDTGVYLVHSQLSLLDRNFWLFGGYRPFVTPLILKIFHQNLALVNKFFIVSYLCAALGFIFVSMRFFAGAREKMIAGYVFILLFLNQNSISVWLSCAMSETPSIVMTLFVFALCGILYVARETLRRNNLRASAAVGMMLLTIALFAFTRDSNLYFLPCLVPFYAAVFKRWRYVLILSVMTLAVFYAGKITADSTGRWTFPLGNILGWRILPDEQLRRLFQAQYHLPPDEFVLPCAQKWASETCPQKEYLDSWIREYGFQAYQQFLLTHPQYVLKTWINAWDTAHEGLWILAFQPKYYADPKVRAKKLNAVIFNFPGEISFTMALLVAFFGCLLLKENPLILLCVAHAFIIGIISFHGDAMEVSRHAQQAAMTLKIAFLLCFLQVYHLIAHVKQPSPCPSPNGEG